MKKNHFYFTILFLIVNISIVLSQSTAQFILNTDTLVVYKNVPGFTSSDKYTIRVKSAATNNEWVDVFVNVTNNKGIPGSTDLN